jgi:hypothetical protein
VRHLFGPSASPVRSRSPIAARPVLLSFYFTSIPCLPGGFHTRALQKKEAKLQFPPLEIRQPSPSRRPRTRTRAHHRRRRQHRRLVLITEEDIHVVLAPTCLPRRAESWRRRRPRATGVMARGQQDDPDVPRPAVQRCRSISRTRRSSP